MTSVLSMQFICNRYEPDVGKVVFFKRIHLKQAKRNWSGNEDQWEKQNRNGGVKNLVPSLLFSNMIILFISFIYCFSHHW